MGIQWRIKDFSDGSANSKGGGLTYSLLEIIAKYVVLISELDGLYYASIVGSVSGQNSIVKKCPCR